MGMYTSLHLTLELKKDTPAHIIEILRFMTGARPDEPPTPLEPLFRSERWAWMLQSSSYYFDHEAHSSLDFKGSDQWRFPLLFVECDFKNYDSEIEHFLHWIARYVNEDGYPEYHFVGYTRYEEEDDPTLIYFHNGAFQLRTVEGVTGE